MSPNLAREILFCQPTEIFFLLSLLPTPTIHCRFLPPGGSLSLNLSGLCSLCFLNCSLWSSAGCSSGAPPQSPPSDPLSDSEGIHQNSRCQSSSVPKGEETTQKELVIYKRPHSQEAMEQGFYPRHSSLTLLGLPWSALPTGTERLLVTVSHRESSMNCGSSHQPPG